MKKTVKTETRRPERTQARRLILIDKQVLLTNFHVNIFSVRSKLSELQPQT